MTFRFSRYGAASTEPSPVNRMMAAFASDFRDGIDCNLGVGYVNEATIPVEAFEEALAAVAADPQRYRQSFNYGGAEGSPNLIASLRRFLSRPGGLDSGTLERKRLIIGSCGATSLLDAFADVLEPGIVVTSDPLYYIYSDLLERRGFEILAIPEDAEGIDPAALEAKLAALGESAARVAFFYAVTVNNPSCTVLSNRRRRALFEIAAALSRRQGRQIPILFDLAYELLLHDPTAEPFASVLPDDDLGIVYETGTLSKVLAPALRVGYLLGPDGPLLNAIVQKTSDTGFSAPLFVQEMASWLLDHRIEAQLRAVNAGYREKALAVGLAVQDELGEFIEDCCGGRAGFYFYLTLGNVETHAESRFFRVLTRTTGDSSLDGGINAIFPRVIYVPGTYCVHPRGTISELGRRQLRLSYGFETVARISHALELMKAAAAEASNHQPGPKMSGHIALS